MKKVYIKPALTETELHTGHVLAESGGTNGYNAQSGSTDVTFESRDFGWHSENWSEE